jgi:hypothetical protein
LAIVYPRELYIFDDTASKGKFLVAT